MEIDQYTNERVFIHKRPVSFSMKKIKLLPLGEVKKEERDQVKKTKRSAFAAPIGELKLFVPDHKKFDIPKIPPTPSRFIKTVIYFVRGQIVKEASRGK